MTGNGYNILFLCTGNSARSILAEAIINRIGRGKFHGYSAGSHPKGEVHPTALELLKHFNYPTGDLRSKNWDEFAEAGTPEMDFVFTVCDRAAAEMCPVWPSKPVTSHWGVPDPAEVEGDKVQQMEAFREAFNRLENRIKVFVSLPFESPDRLKLQKSLDEIGRI